VKQRADSLAPGNEGWLEIQKTPIQIRLLLPDENSQWISPDGSPTNAWTRPCLERLNVLRSDVLGRCCRRRWDDKSYAKAA